MEELLEIIKNNKTNFLYTPYGIIIKMNLYDIISSLLSYNDMVNERGDSYEFSDLLKYEEHLKILVEDMDTKENTVLDSISDSNSKEERIRGFYESLNFQTIKDVETGVIYRYVVL